MRRTIAQQGYAIVWILIAAGIVLLVVALFSGKEKVVPGLGFEVYSETALTVLTEEERAQLSKVKQAELVSTDGNTPVIQHQPNQQTQYYYGSSTSGQYLWDGSSFSPIDTGSTISLPNVSGGGGYSGGGIDAWVIGNNGGGSGEEDESNPPEDDPPGDDPENSPIEAEPEYQPVIEEEDTPDSPDDDPVEDTLVEELNTTTESSEDAFPVLIQLIERNPSGACSPVVVAVQATNPVVIGTIRIDQRPITNPDQISGIAPYLLLHNRLVTASAELDILGTIEPCVPGGAESLRVSLWRNITGDIPFSVEILP